MDRTGVVVVVTLGLIVLFSSSSQISASQEVDKLSQGLIEDAQALQAFKLELENDPSGALWDWGGFGHEGRVNANPCRWRGVECARVAGAPEHSSEERVVGLDLWGLELEGPIAYEIGQLTQLRKLALVGNKLSGDIPAEIRNCEKLQILDLRANQLSGSIGFSLADLPRLQILKLSENQLTGSLTGLFGKSYVSFDPFQFLDNRNSKDVSMKRCSRLEILDLAQNSLSGILPSALGGCPQLVELSLNENVFTGSIPSSLSSLPKLRSLLLNNNRLDGSLPASIASCKKLQSLNVADNRLEGLIPLELAEFSGARYFNFSNNRLEGRIPVGKWNVQQLTLAGMFSNNPGLCGWPLSHACSQSRTTSSLRSSASLASECLTLATNVLQRLQNFWKSLVSAHVGGRGRLVKIFRLRRSLVEEAAAPAWAPTGAPTHKKSNHTVRKWALGLTLGLVVGALAAALLATMLRLCVFFIHKTPYLQGPIIFHHDISPKMLLFLERGEALGEAEVVGEGGAGKVYKIKLEDMMVAVKSVTVKADQKGNFGQRQIQAELDTLGCIRHRNLAMLLAYVHRPDSHLLLYKYMENGSLQGAIHKFNQGEIELPWPIRHKIAVGTCRGLSYLHFNSQPRIVHRDLKPSNILLDETFTAHVSDFGLAKIIPGADSHVTTGVAGTLGYIAPEYSQTCRFTDKSDMYAFGVVMAVLLTGKDPTDQFFTTVSGGSIGMWLHDLLQKGEAKEAIDPKVFEDEYEEEILLAAKVAVFCTNENPQERPSSKDVLIMLNQIRREEP